MLKRLTLIALATFVTFVCNAQKLKKKVETYSNLKEVYYVNKKTGLRQGKSYIFNTDTKDTVAIGAYNNDRRIGEWVFADRKNGKKYIAYEFTAQKLNYLDKEAVADSFLVFYEGGYVKKKVDRPLIYTGFSDELEVMCANQIQIPVSDMQAGKAGLSLLQFFVDEQGTITGTNLVSSYSKEIDQCINTIVSRLPGRFLPVLENGEPVKSCFFIRVNIGMPTETFAHLRKEPFIKHIDITYISQTVRRRSLGYAVKRVSGPELQKRHY